MFGDLEELHLFGGRDLAVKGVEDDDLAREFEKELFELFELVFHLFSVL